MHPSPNPQHSWNSHEHLEREIRKEVNLVFQNQKSPYDTQENLTNGIDHLAQPEIPMHGITQSLSLYGSLRTINPQTIPEISFRYNKTNCTYIHLKLTNRLFILPIPKEAMWKDKRTLTLAHMMQFNTDTSKRFYFCSYLCQSFVTTSTPQNFHFGLQWTFKIGIRPYMQQAQYAIWL